MPGGPIHAVEGFSQNTSLGVGVSVRKTQSAFPVFPEFHGLLPINVLVERVGDPIRKIEEYRKIYPLTGKIGQMLELCLRLRYQ